jgi:putative hemolysin
MEAAREPCTPGNAEAERYKREVEELKAKLAAMETEQTQAEGKPE